MGVEAMVTGAVVRWGWERGLGVEAIVTGPVVRWGWERGLGWRQ